MEYILKTGAKYSPGNYIRKKMTDFIPIHNNNNIPPPLSRVKSDNSDYRIK